jgi:hypothetical protein
MAVPPGELLDGIYWVPALTPEPAGAFSFDAEGLRKAIADSP